MCICSRSKIKTSYLSVKTFRELNAGINSTEPTDDFWVNVLANKKLKSDFTWGLKTNGRLGITKDEFFNKVKGEA